MEKEFTFNFRYIIYVFLNIFLCFLFFLMSLVLFTFEEYFSVISIYIIVFILNFIFLKNIPIGFSLKEDFFIKKNILWQEKIFYSEIFKIQCFQSTRHIIWHMGDKKKTPMLCFVRLRKKTFSFFLFSNYITDHRKLYDCLKEKMAERGN